MTIPILLDCDPGHDDALALMLALARPELELVGVTTVAGNATLEHVTENCLRVLALLGRDDVPVAAGAARPLTGELRTAPHVHGESGIEGAPLPDPVREPEPETALGFASRLLEQRPEGVTIVAVGPLTNVAGLLRERPDLHERVRAITIMGGTVTEGNITPSAEFNAWVDPEAARIVVRSGLQVTMTGLDVTHQALVTEEEIRALQVGGGRVSGIVGDLLAYFQQFHRRVYGWRGCPIHDAVPVAELAAPGLVPSKPYAVDVELEGTLTRGRTVVDLRGVTGQRANVDVAVGIDRDTFVTMLLDAIRSFD